MKWNVKKMSNNELDTYFKGLCSLYSNQKLRRNVMSVINLPLEIVEEVGKLIVRGIVGNINSTQKELPEAIKSVITENGNGTLTDANVQIDAKIFLKIGNFEGNLEISYPPLSVK
jgi:hypothetical protein